MAWTQTYDPLHSWILSTLVAALPILVLFGLLAGLRVKPHWCAIAGAGTAVAVAVLIFGMPFPLAGMSFLYGVAFGVLKIAWIVLAAVYLYDISVYTGQFEIMKESVAGITPDRRLQLLLVAFCFGAFIEGAAGFGAPVAIAGAFMIGLGFQPFHAAALNLIANTSPVAWGAIGTPVHTLAAVSGLPESDLSAMIGRILPITGLIVPFWLVRAMVGWSETIDVLPAILVVGTSFSLTQYLWSNHVDSNLVDIAPGDVHEVRVNVIGPEILRQAEGGPHDEYRGQHFDGLAPSHHRAHQPEGHDEAGDGQDAADHRAQVGFRQPGDRRERVHRRPDRPPRHRRRVGDQIERGGVERLEAEPDHEGARNRDRRPESRRPLDEGAEAERDQQQLQPAVGGDPRHRLLHDLELARKHRDVVEVDRGQDDPRDLQDAECHPVEEAHAGERERHPEDEDGDGDRRPGARDRAPVRLHSEPRQQAKQHEDRQGRHEGRKDPIVQRIVHLGPRHGSLLS